MKNLILTLFIAVFIFSCKKNTATPDGTTTTTNSGTKLAPDGFLFNTTRIVNLNLTLKATNGDALSNVLVSIYAPDNTTVGSAIFKGITDNSGNLTVGISVPTYIIQIVIDPGCVGLMHYALANINNNAVTATLGGATGYSGDIVPKTVVSASGNSSGLTTLATGATALFYPSGLLNTASAVTNTSSQPAALGVPNYLDPKWDNITQSIINYISASFPEGLSQTDTHPNFLASSATSSLNITTASDVWITFVGNGSSNLNSLAYYTYNTATPPTADSVIHSATIIFPNATATGSGGGLVAGNRVKIGTFSAGTSIGFLLLANAWTGSGVNTQATKYFSNSPLNAESGQSLKKHAVFLYDDVHKITVIGFEDTNRAGTTDNDFNDLVVYATSNPVNGISTNGVAAIDKGIDTDGDGVIDLLDAYPNDPTRAFNNYFPSQNTYITLCFEDNWPMMGDFDMNDMVVKYRYTYIENVKSQVIALKCDYIIVAAGASFKNGFGLQLTIAPSQVASVTGQQIIGNYIKLEPNGVEAGHVRQAVIIPFDNTDALINNPDGSFFVNTLSSKDKVVSKTASVLITFASPFQYPNLIPAALNPFLISNGRRGYEIHLPGDEPTELADASLFGTGDDATNVSQGRYYHSKNNYPWAMEFVEDTFKYPLETISLIKAYPHFTDWASTNGSVYQDWYSSADPTYRNNAFLYLK